MKAVRSGKRRFGKLLILAQERRGKEMWVRARCDCGKTVTRRADPVKALKVQSCGCKNWSADTNRERAITQSMRAGLRRVRAGIKRLTAKLSVLRAAERRMSKRSS